jgi:hypothetical protein
MELERPGEERKNRRDAMADDSPGSESAEDGSFLMTQRAEEDDEHGEVDASSDAGGMASGAGEPGGRRSREKQPSIVRVCAL